MSRQRSFRGEITSVCFNGLFMMLDKHWKEGYTSAPSNIFLFFNALTQDYLTLALCQTETRSCSKNSHDCCSERSRARAGEPESMPSDEVLSREFSHRANGTSVLNSNRAEFPQNALTLTKVLFNTGIRGTSGRRMANQFVRELSRGD